MNNFLIIFTILVFLTIRADSQTQTDSSKVEFLNISDLKEGRGKWISMSIIDKMKTLVEKYYGKGDSDYNFVGIGFYYDTPKIYYPTFPSNSIAINLTSSTLIYPNQAYFQLSHEVFHLLSPTGKFDSNNLEEGLACNCTKKYFQLYQHNNYDWESGIKADSRYYNAYLLTDQLLKIDSSIIKKVRERFPTCKISHLKIEYFEELLGDRTPYEILQKLLSPFPNN